MALSYLLDYTGPIELADGTRLTSDNAVDLLLHEAYEKYSRHGRTSSSPGPRQIFDALLTAQGPWTSW